MENEYFVRAWTLTGPAFCKIEVYQLRSPEDLEFLKKCFDRTLKELEEIVAEIAKAGK